LSGAGTPVTSVKSRKQESTVTWIAYDNQIFRLTSMIKNSGAKYRDAINQSISSFHQLTAKQKTIFQVFCFGSSNIHVTSIGEKPEKSNRPIQLTHLRHLYCHFPIISMS
jgi:predicted Zn-dependent protease